MLKSNYNLNFFALRGVQTDSKQIKMIGRKISIIGRKFTCIKTVFLHLFVGIAWPFSNGKLKGKIQKKIGSFPLQLVQYSSCVC